MKTSNKIAAGIAVGGVSIIVSLILISSGSKPPIVMTGKIYSIDGVEEIVTTNHKENRFFIEGREVREWEYLDERPKYLAKIEDNKRRIVEERKAAAEERVRKAQLAIKAKEPVVVEKKEPSLASLFKREEDMSVDEQIKELEQQLRNPALNSYAFTKIGFRLDKLTYRKKYGAPTSSILNGYNGYEQLTFKTPEGYKVIDSNGNNFTMKFNE